MRRTELRKKVLYALAVASVATFVHGGGVPTYAAFTADNVLPQDNETVKTSVEDGRGYFYGVTGGNVYLDNPGKDLLGEVDGIVNYDINNLPQAPDPNDPEYIKEFMKLVASEMIKSELPDVANVIDAANEKTQSGSTIIQGYIHRNLNGYTLDDGTKADWIRYYAVIGGDAAINTGLNGDLKISASVNSSEQNIEIINIDKQYTSEDLDITRVGDSNVVIGGHDEGNEGSSVSVIGGVGGSAAASLGNVTIDIPDASKELFGIGNITVGASTLTLNGTATTTLQGNVNTQVEKDANVVGWMNGGLAAGVGGQATSTVTGNTTLTIDGTDRRTDIGLETPADNPYAKDQLTHGLDMMKKSGVNAIGVLGGGTAVTTLGGEATAAVGGTSTINVNNATVIGVVGGGAAASVDATGVADELKLNGTDNPTGNDNGHSDVTGSQLEGLLNKTGTIPDALTITATSAINGGTAKAITGDTDIAFTGDSTVAGAIGGGIAVASHTYTWKGDGTKEDNTYSVNDEYGKSVAEATTGKSHITIALDSKLPDWNSKNDMLDAVKNFAGQLADSAKVLEPDVLKDFANKGAAVGVFGGGVAIAQSGNEQFVNEENKGEGLSKTDGAFATATTDGTDIQLAGGYIAGVMGGGIAGAVNNSTATAEMSDDVDITIGGYVDENGDALNAEVVGVFGNGLAYFTGEAHGGDNPLKGQAAALAGNTNINVRGGLVDGIIGGGMAIDDSDASYKNAIAKTSGTASINVSGGTVNKVDAFTALSSIFENSGVSVSEPSLDGYVDGVNAAASNAAIAAGGIALGGGAEAYVENAQVNVVGGDVKGDVYAGGISAFGYKDSDTKGSHVENAMLNLTGGTIDGNVYAGGAVATKTSNGAAVYGSYDQAKATVGTATVNLAGTDVTGVLYGKGTVNQKVVDDDTAAQAAVENSTLNLIGQNTLSYVTNEDASISSKIDSFDNVNATAGSVTKLDKDMQTGQTAIINGGTVTVADSAILDISELQVADGTYNVAQNYENGSTFWKNEDLQYDRFTNYAETVLEDTTYGVKFSELTDENKDAAANELADFLDAGAIKPLIDHGYAVGWDNVDAGAAEYFRDWNDNAPAMNAAFGRGMMIGEDSAVTGNTVSVARDVADEVSQHLSFTEDFVQDHDSIYGDDNIWAKYIHNKFETDGMSSSFGDITADNDYNGVIVGYDFNQSGKLQSGVAIHYGHGDGTGSFSRNDYDAWGVSLYGALKDEEAGTNLMADIGYTKTSNDITGTLNGKDLMADRDLTAWTIGVRGEKEFVSGRNQIVPYVGLRYMNVDPSSYTSYYNGKKAFEYDADKQDIWMVPLGVSFRNETKTGSGWRITPKLDVAYIWASGDTDNEVDVNMAGASAPLYYTVMDDGSWLASLGIDASHGAWTFGAGYAYQKGDDTKNNKWYVNAGFAF